MEEVEMNDEKQATTNGKTIIGRDAHFKSEISFKNNLQILGSYEGQITTTGNLEVSSEAEVNADIKAGSIIVDGSIQGNLDASDIIELKTTSHVRGDITCERLIMVEGASFEGQCQVGKAMVESVLRPD